MIFNKRRNTETDTKADGFEGKFTPSNMSFKFLVRGTVEYVENMDGKVYKNFQPN